MIENLSIDYGGDMTLRYISFKSETYEDFREKMLLHNSISGYLRLDINYGQGVKEYRYDVSDKRSLRELLSEKNMDEEWLLGLLRELERIFIKGKSYMFDEADYVLHPDALYFNNERNVQVVYLPGYEKNVQDQLCDLLEYLMNCVDVSDRRSVYAVYSTYAAAKNGNCTFSSLIALLEKNMEEFSGLENDFIKKEEGKGKKLSENEGKRGLERLVRPGNAEKRLISQGALVFGFVLVILYFIFS